MRYMGDKYMHERLVMPIKTPGLSFVGVKKASTGSRNMFPLK